MPKVEAIFTMVPLPDRSRCGTAYFVQRNTPPRLIASTRSQSSSGNVSTGAPGPGIPALLTSTSIWPNASITAAIIACTLSVDETSHATNRASPPDAAIDETVASPRSASRSTTTTRSPLAPSRYAIARPMPEPEPVTIATRCAMIPPLLVSPIVLSLFWQHHSQFLKTQFSQQSALRTDAWTNCASIRISHHCAQFIVDFYTDICLTMKAPAAILPR